MRAANSIPTSIGAAIGKVIDNSSDPNTVGPYQNYLGIANDALSIYASPKGLSPAWINYTLRRKDMVQ